MATITFKGKIIKIYNPDDTLAWEEIRIPKLTSNHCNMHEFRTHPVYGGLANSVLFPNVLAKIRRGVLASDYADSIRLDNIPENVTINTKGFLAVVTITV